MQIMAPVSRQYLLFAFEENCSHSVRYPLARRLCLRFKAVVMEVIWHCRIGTFGHYKENKQ